MIQNNVITNNAQSGCSGGSGGGIKIGGAGSAEVLDNTISNNSGGGIVLNAAGTPTIRDNIISGNTRGGISMGNTSDALIVQNVITGNTGSGISWGVPSGNRGPLLVNNTISDNDSAQGSGIFADGFDAQTELINNIIIAKAGQTAVFCGDFNDLNPPIFGFNNVFSSSGAAYGGICTDQTGIDGNISADPLFADPSTGNYRLDSGSPSIEAGDNTAPDLPATDIAGNDRVLDGDGDGVAIVDMGAYEFGASRALTDQPDDSSDFQIHVMYVLPIDGVDEGLDTNGTIATSVAAFNTWFAGQSGGPRLRLDTSGGALDITFFRLSRTDAEIRSFGAFVRDQIELELKAAGFNQANKIYAVYYGGSSDFACGGGAWPPTLPGIVAALYLKGEPPGAPPCVSNPFATSEATPGYWEFSMVHELLHTLGVVATCAPNHTLAGHVSDDNRDLMYAGALPWQPSLLDIGNDDYWNHSNAGCLDLARSAFLDPTPPGAVAPPGF